MRGIMSTSGAFIAGDTIRQVLAPIAQAHGMPNEAYVSDDFFHAERDVLMARTWVCIGFASDLAKKSYVRPVEFMGLPLIIMCNKQGEIQVFHNVCSHR